MEKTDKSGSRIELEKADVKSCLFDDSTVEGVGKADDDDERFIFETVGVNI